MLGRRERNDHARLALQSLAPSAAPASDTPVALSNSAVQVTFDAIEMGVPQLGSEVDGSQPSKFESPAADAVRFTVAVLG